MPPRATSLSRPSRPLLPLLVPLALAVAAYARVLDGEFQFDDGETVVRQLAVKDLGGFLRDHLVQGFLSGARPVTDLTFALNYAVGGLEPRNFHPTSLVLHLAVAVLVWAFGRSVLRLAGAPRAEWIAVAAAGVFALHPLHSEAVSYVSQRSEVLASGLYLATLLLLLAAERRGLNRRGAPFLAGALASFLLALGAKAIAVTLPAAWLLLVIVVPAPERRAELLSWRARSLALLPFAALDALFSARLLLGLGAASDAGFNLPQLPPLTYFLTELRAIAVYLRLLVWPAGQNVDWDFPLSRALAGPAVVLALLLLLALAAGAVALALAARRRGTEDAAASRVAAFGVLWFFVLLSVTSSFVPLADVISEHRVYLASWGAFIAVAVLAERLLARVPAPRHAAFGLVGLLALWTVLAIALHRRNAVWESRLALWTDAVSKSPAKARPNMNLGFALKELGRNDESIAAYRKAVELARGDPDLEVRIHRDLAAALLSSRRIDEALDVLGRAAAIQPNDPGTLTNLAAAFGAKKDFPRARAYALRALLVDPSQGYAWNVLGSIQLEEGDLAGARASLERAMALDPDVGVRGYSLGKVLLRQGDRAGACAAWARALGGGLTPSLRAEVDRLRALEGCAP